jgi:adenine-specific DNA-methyltransferase
MQLNAEDGGNRKFIMVQLDEPIDAKKSKTAYDFVKNELGKDKPTIFDITQERLIRSAKKIQKDNEALKDKNKKDLSTQDFGFKVFETISNNDGVWEDYLFEADEIDDEQELFNSDNLTDEDLKVLLTTWKTNDNIALTQNLTAINLDGYIGYYFATKLYLLNTGFKTKNLKKLLEEVDSNKDFNPANIIAFGHNFESKNLREIAENIKSYANNKHIDIDFITRY